MRSNIAWLVLALLPLVSLPAVAAGGEPEVQPEWTPLTAHLQMLSGVGGNVAVLTGDDGTWIVDSGYAELVEHTTKAIRARRDEPVRAVVATHWHFDHVGGFEAFAAAGATLLAQENIRARMTGEQHIAVLDRTVPPSPPGALADVTFDETLTLYANGEVIRLVHVPRAHTDGDTIVIFDTADVIHTGDLFFHPCYPFIDVANGGSIDGMIAGAEEVLRHCGPGTRIIPGHGPLASPADLQAYLAMLRQFREAMADQIAAGKDLAQIQQAGATAELDAVWGGTCFTAEQFTEIVVRSLRGD